MRVEPVVKPAAVRARLLKLVAECDSFSWASAWVTENVVFEAAIAHRRKIRHFLIGTHRYVTSVGCLDTCLGIAQVKVVAPTGPMFHPKLYAFQLKGRVVLYVGSSNLTRAGLARNVESGVFLSAESNHPKLQQYFDFIEDQWSHGEMLDADFVASYRANKERVKDAQEALKQFVRIKKPRTRSAKSANDVDPTKMTWDHFVELVKSDKTHGLDARLAVLSKARELFASRVLRNTLLARSRDGSLANQARKCLIRGAESGHVPDSAS